MANCQYFPYQFYSSAIRSTAIEHCVSGNFTSEVDLNLIIVKNSRLEISLVGPEGLSAIKEVKIYGKIADMKLFRASDKNKDYLFILTCRYDAMILEAIKVNNELEIHTRAHGNVADRIGKICENGITAVIEPQGRVICLRLNEGLLKFIPLEKDTSELKAFNIRIEENEIQDINFLFGCMNPTIILLYEDFFGRHIKTYEFCSKEKEFSKMPWKQDNIEMEATMLIPVPEPLCGAIIIGQESILYHDGTTFVAVAPPVIRNSSINCYAKVDSEGRRYILGDFAGHLFLLLIEVEEKMDSSFNVRDVKVELLGEVSIPECITYLDNGVLFIGSKLGDSQLVKLNQTLNDKTGSYVTILDTFTNIGPIVDMVVVDLERQGQSQLVTCSGGFKDGTLRIIRNGVGIQEKATIDLYGIKGIWAMNTLDTTSYDNVLVLSFLGYSRVLSLTGEEVEEIELFGFHSDHQLILCRKLGANVILQITSLFVSLICLDRKQILSTWMIASNRTINLAAANTNQIVCASGREIFYLEVINFQIIEQKRSTLVHEVSCIDITSLPDEVCPYYIALGLWNDISIRILRLPTLDEVHRENLGGETISRSILFATLEEINYLFCALGDGCVFCFTFIRHTGLLFGKKRITLGTQPIIFQPFKSMDNCYIFVCSDRPTIIYSSNRKLVFSSVNLKAVNHICHLNSESYPDSLAFSNDSILTIGTIDDIQKLHIRTVRLNESPRRIAHQASSETFGVISSRFDIQGATGLVIQRECASCTAQIISKSKQNCSLHSPSSAQTVPIGTEVEVHNFLLFDQHTFEVFHAYQMQPNEYALSLISCKLGNDSNFYYIVGTGIVNQEENEPIKGRILVFQVDQGKLIMVHDKEVKGGCYSFAEFNGKLLVCINSVVRLFEWSLDKILRLECNHFNNIIALYVKTKGDFVLVGDLMRALTLLQYRSFEGSFQEIARDYNPNWMTAIEILDDDTFLGAENCLNLFICQKDSSATNEDVRDSMQEVGLFHLGDMVNVFRIGSLVRKPMDEISALSSRSVLFGTASGAVGFLTHISREVFNLLNELQESLSTTIKSVGRIEHSFWRSFYSETKTVPAESFIDGELIECFLDLSRSDMEQIVKGLRNSLRLCQIGNASNMKYQMNEEAPVDAVIKIIENLIEFH